MGFDCKFCGEREVWAFESAPLLCLDCFLKKCGSESFREYWNNSLDRRIGQITIDKTGNVNFDRFKKREKKKRLTKEDLIPKLIVWSGIFVQRAKQLNNLNLN